MHSEWEEMSNHEVVSMEKIQNNIKQLVPPKKVTLYCSQHEGMKLELYCETCGELICLHCTVKKHKDHLYDLVGDTFERHKAEITASLKPVEEQLGVVSKALEQYGARSQELDELEVAMEANIGQEIQKLREILEGRKIKLVGQMKQLIQTKRKNLTMQKDEVETVHTQLVSCLSFVKESLRTGSQGEVMKMKKTVVKQIKEMTDNFKPELVPPCEHVNIKFIHSSELTQACQQFGEVYSSQLSPEKCFAKGDCLEVAELNEKATAMLFVIDQKEKCYTAGIETPTCELIPNNSSNKIDCLVRKREGNKYELSYQATSRGWHQLHIKVEGEHIKGSPFSITVIKALGAPTKTISGVKEPFGVAVNQRGEIIVTEDSTQCVSIFNPTGEKLRSFGSQGSGYGQFKEIRGVAVDDDGNIYVADGHNDRIQKFTSNGKFITTLGKDRDKYLEFDVPRGIAIHPHSKKLYVADYNNHRLQILNPNLTFSGSIGSRGNGNGQLKNPSDVAFDNSGNVYVADTNNHRIQVFTAEGGYLRQFRRGKGNGQLNSPTGIAIDSDNVVYVTEYRNFSVLVFTCEGKFLTSFGSEGSGPGQFYHPYGITVDGDGVVYVSDKGNNRLQIF